MKHLAAYLLLQTGGNASPSAANIKSLLEVVGIEAEEEKLNKLLAELEGKDINEVGQVFRWSGLCESVGWERLGVGLRCDLVVVECLGGRVNRRGTGGCSGWMRIDQSEQV